ncbi:hypothetical protein BX070DRAFT_221314 [Coemansia spiralis]|nr:hypothetical protein BX070DRAFT_221314 [Coemansia spiralis]
MAWLPTLTLILLNVATLNSRHIIHISIIVSTAQAESSGLSKCVTRLFTSPTMSISWLFSRWCSLPYAMYPAHGTLIDRSPLDPHSLALRGWLFDWNCAKDILLVCFFKFASACWQPLSEETISSATRRRDSSQKLVGSMF